MVEHFPNRWEVLGTIPSITYTQKQYGKNDLLMSSLEGIKRTKYLGKD